MVEAVGATNLLGDEGRALARPSRTGRSATRCPRCSCSCRAATTWRRPRKRRERLLDAAGVRRHARGAQRQRVRGRRHVVLLAARAAHRRRPGDPGVGRAPRGLPRAVTGLDHPAAMSARPSRRPARALGVLTTSEGTHRGAFTPLDWGLFAAIGGIWGSSFLFIAIGLEAFEPGLVTWLRVLFGAARAVAGARRAEARRPRRPATAGRALGAVGGHPLHAVPARRAADHLGAHRAAQRLAAHLRRGDRRGDAAPSARPRPGDRPRRGLRRGSPLIALPAAGQGIERGAGRPAGAPGGGLLRRRRQHRHAPDPALRRPAGHGAHARARRDLDRALRTLGARRSRRSRGTRSRRCSRWVRSAPGWRSC